jgi:hypothetical protein
MRAASFPNPRRHRPSPLRLVLVLLAPPAALLLFIVIVEWLAVALP